MEEIIATNHERKRNRNQNHGRVDCNLDLIPKRKKLDMNGDQKAVENPVKAEVQEDQVQEDQEQEQQAVENPVKAEFQEDQVQEDQEQEQEQKQEQEQEQVQEQTNKCVCIYLINKYYCENCKNKKNT